MPYIFTAIDISVGENGEEKDGARPGIRMRDVQVAECRGRGERNSTGGS